MNETQPFERNKMCSFGRTKSVLNENTGVNVPKFVIEFNVHYSPVRRTANQTYDLVGTRLDKTRVIKIRHGQNVNDQLLVEIDNETYDIVDISIDDTNKYLTYDIITLKKHIGH